MQYTYNIFEQCLGPALLDAYNAGIDIIIKEVITNRQILCSNTVKQYAEQLSCSVDQLAIECILAQPFKLRVSKAEFIAEHLKNDEKLLNTIIKDYLIDSEEYWKKRSELVMN